MAIITDHLDIHPSTHPVVDVGPSLSSPLPTSPTAARTEALALLSLSKQIDSELQHHYSTLKSNGVDQTSSLIDSNGFPLADKDLVAIRSARNRIAMLHNDSKAVRERVEKLLELAINGEAVAGAEKVESGIGERGEARKEERLEPFARINLVASGSPAEHAGLRVDDQLVRFSSIDKSNNDGLKALARPGIVTDGETLQVVVQRRSGASTSSQLEVVTLSLTPASGWGGRGLLGCHIVPLNTKRKDSMNARPSYREERG